MSSKRRPRVRECRLRNISWMSTALQMSKLLCEGFLAATRVLRNAAVLAVGTRSAICDQRLTPMHGHSNGDAQGGRQSRLVRVGRSDNYGFVVSPPAV